MRKALKIILLRTFVKRYLTKFNKKRNCYCENDSRKIISTLDLNEPLCNKQVNENSTDLYGSSQSKMIRFYTLKCNL